MAMKTRFLSAATLAIARLVPELVPPISMSTPCWSNHSRALEAATSALFWWSAEMNSTRLPGTTTPASAIAILTASAPPCPSMSEQTPDISVIRPILMTSPEIWACAAQVQPSAHKTAAVAFSFMLSPWWIRVKNRSRKLHAEQLGQYRHLGAQLGCSKRLDDPTVLHHIKPVRQRRRETEILLDHDNGVALCLQRQNHARQALHDDRRQALGDFVEQQQPRAGAQYPRHRQHLLLAARQPGALAVLALFEIGKHRVNVRHRHARRGTGQLWRQHQVFLGRQRRENASLLGTVANPEVGDLMRRQTDRFNAIDLDRALARACQAHDAAQRHHLARLHRQIDVVQNMRFAIPGVQMGDFQRRGHHCAPSSAAASVPIYASITCALADTSA